MRTTSDLSVREVVENYVPRDSREEKDKQQMLRFIDNFDDVLTRDNTLGHFTASSFIVDKSKTKMLAIYHTIGNGWAHPGGHADGEKDFLSVAVREAKEETGLDVNVLDERPFLLSVNPVSGHMKKGVFVPSHLHFDVFYLMEADDTAPLVFRKDESKGVKWIPFNNLDNEQIANSMRPVVERLINSLKVLK